MNDFDRGEDAGPAFKAQMAITFANTVVGVAMVAIPGLFIARAITSAALSPVMLVYLQGIERGISWLPHLPPNYLYVLAHGSARGPIKPPRPEMASIVTGEDLTVEEVSGAILNHKYYRRGRRVVMISCQVGDGPFPSQLAQAIGAPVYASPDYVNIGLLTVPDLGSLPRLNWRIFRNR